MGLPPSDQSECTWQSPRRARRSASASSETGGASDLETQQIRGCRPGERLLDDARGGRPDARETLQCPALAPLLELRVGKRTNDGGCIAKGTHAIRGLALAFKDVRNALQRCDGVLAACQLRVAIRIDSYSLGIRYSAVP